MLKTYYNILGRDYIKNIKKNEEEHLDIYFSNDILEEYEEFIFAVEDIIANNLKDCIVIWTLGRLTFVRDVPGVKFKYRILKIYNYSLEEFKKLLLIL